MLSDSPRRAARPASRLTVMPLVERSIERGRHAARSGFTAATILEIAAACGISRAGLLHHFSSK
jgi:AcrR family transcriptional regulator